MADKYSIDDILKEVGNSREKPEEFEDADNRTIPYAGQQRGSATELFDSDVINRALRAGAQKKGEQKPSAKKTDLSVTQVLKSVGKERGLSAKQLTEQESDNRRKADIARAFEKREASKTPVKPESPKLSARQLTEEESDKRRALEIRNAADMKKWERLREVSEEDEDFIDTVDYDKELVHPESEYVKPYVKPDVAGEDDDIIFHTRGDLVTTETMEMRKQKKIEDINQALLKIDMEAENPDDYIDSLNPMETREKAEEILREAEDGTDTLAVAGNDLKRIARGEEHVKEYHPSSSILDEDDEIVQRHDPVFPAEIHVGESIVDALNKKIYEQQEHSEEKTAVIGDIPENSSDNDSDSEISENSEVEKIRRANELAQKKKRKIANFILETPDTEEFAAPAEEAEEEADDYEDDEPVDLDDENVIRDRLSRADKGLKSRLLIIAVLFAATLFVAVINQFNINLGGLNNIVSRRYAPENFLYTHLTIGILSFAACSSVITNGFSRLIKLRPDADTLCAFAHAGAIGALVPYLFRAEFIQLGNAHVYLLLSLGALLFNTLSKLFTVKTAQKNFEFTYQDRPKYFIGQCEKSGAEKLAKGAVEGIPEVGTMRKTEMLTDFIISTYCEDASDRLSRKIVPAVLAAGAACALAAFFTSAGESEMVINRINWAITAFTAVLSVGAAFSGSMTVTLPLLLSAEKNNRRGSAILGYGAAAELAEYNAVLLEASSLFTPECVKITNICGYKQPQNHGEGKVNIDEAIILAASLAVASDSVLADAFFGMLNYKRELLKNVSDCVYENNLGVMGWIDRRRILLGNRRHMKNHEITVPNMRKEAAANVNNDEVIYLAVGGEVCLMFFIHLSANKTIKNSLRSLTDSGVSLIIRTVDGMLTEATIAELFDLDADRVRIIPFDSHEVFGENTKYVTNGSAAANCTGTIPSFAGAIREGRLIRSRTYISSVIQMVGIALGILLMLIFALFTVYNMFSPLFVLIYNLVFGAAAAGAVLLKRK